MHPYSNCGGNLRNRADFNIKHSICETCRSRLRELVREECLLTHSNPLVTEAAVIYVQAIASLLRGAYPQAS